MPQLQKSPYADVSADDINQTYRQGYITAAQKNDIMRKKADASLSDIVNDQGAFKAMWTETIKNLQENWDTLKELATTPEPDISHYQEAKNGVRAAWAMIQLATAPLNAIGDVSGNVAEQMALSAGASPGLAKTLGIAVNVGTGFIPVGSTIKQAAKGYQAAGGFVGKAGKAAGAAKTVAQQAAEKAVQEGADKLIKESITKGLQADGLNVAELPLFKSAAETLTSEAGKASTVTTPAQEFMKSLRQYRTEMAQITKTKPHSQTLQEASKLGITIDDVQKLTPGKAINEAEMAAHLKALDPAVDALKEAAKAVKAGDLEGPQLGKMFQEFFTYSPKFRAAEVTAGRSVEILKETPPMKPLTDLMNSWDPESMAKLAPNAMWANLADDILELSKDGMKQLQVNGGGQAALSGWDKAWPMIREAYTNLLLMRPVTQVRNFLGNVGAASNSTLEREVGGWFSMQGRGPELGRGVAQFNGMMAGIGDGLQGVARAFTKEGAADIGKTDVVMHKIPGTIGRIVNIPGDAMGGMDAFFKAILKRGSIYAQAAEDAAAQGLTGLAKSDYIARRTAMPTASMLEEASAFALEQTFQNDLGTMGKFAQKYGQAGPLALWFPFMKTPINLVKYAWNRTPGLQLLSNSLYEDILAGGSRADMAIGRLTLSNMTGMFIYGLAQQGLLTGGGPSDPGLKRSWLGTKKPYSIMGPDGWYQYSNLDPGTTPVALVADYAEVMNQLDDPTAEQGAMAIGLSMVRDIADKTWWQTVGRMVDIVSSVRAGQEIGPKVMAAAASPLTSVLTLGPLGSATARAIDPVQRETRTFMDTIRARVPGYSQDLPPMRDGYGDPILPPQTLGSKWLSYAVPFTSAPFEEDPIKKEGARLQIRLPQFPWSTGGGKMRDDFDVAAPLPGEAVPVELTPQERDRWQVIYRNIIRDPKYGLPAVMESDAYKNGTWAMQRELFTNTLAMARDGAKSALLTEDVDLAKKVTQASGAKYLPMLQPEQRASIEPRLNESLDLLDDLLPRQREQIMKYGFLDDGKARDEALSNPPTPEISTQYPVTMGGQ